MIDYEKVIRSAYKSGKVFLGSKRALEAVRNGRAVALIVSSNCAKKILEEIKYHAKLSNVSVYTYPSTGDDLGLACGKPFPVSVVTIRSLSDSSLIKALKEAQPLQ